MNLKYKNFNISLYYYFYFIFDTTTLNQPQTLNGSVYKNILNIIIYTFNHRHISYTIIVTILNI